MSDILIKNMKMPARCELCPFSGISGISCELVSCTFTGKHRLFNDGQYLEDCPLIEVPTPHGDLVDKIALLNHMTNVHKEWQEHPEQHKSIITIIDDELIVDFFPAIIKAEGE